MTAMLIVTTDAGLRNVAKNARKSYGIFGTRRVASVHDMKRGPCNPAGHFMSVSEGARLIVLPMNNSGWHARQSVQNWDKIDRLLAEKDLDHGTCVQSLGIRTHFLQQR